MLVSVASVKRGTQL